MIVLAIGIISARAQSSNTTIQFNQLAQPALVLELSNTTDEAKATIIEKLKDTGYDVETKGHLFWKTNTTEGFYVFEKVALSSLSSQKLDLYFKVVQKNNEEKDKSTVYLLVSTGNQNFVSPGGDTTLWNSSKMFLNSFIEKTTAYSLEQNISVQEKTVKDAQNKLVSLQKDEKELTEKIRKNQEEQQNQQATIENKNKILDDLKSKRKS